MWNIENKNKHICFRFRNQMQTTDSRPEKSLRLLTLDWPIPSIVFAARRLHRHLILHKWVFQTPPAEEIHKYVCNVKTLQVSKASFPHTQLREAGGEHSPSRQEQSTHPHRDTAAVWWSCRQNGDAQGRDMMLLGLSMPVSSLVFSKWRWLTPQMSYILHFMACTSALTWYSTTQTFQPLAGTRHNYGNYVYHN